MATITQQVPDKNKEVRAQAAVSKGAAAAANSVPELRAVVAAQADQLTVLTEVVDELRAEVARLGGRRV